MQRTSHHRPRPRGAERTQRPRGEGRAPINPRRTLTDLERTLDDLLRTPRPRPAFGTTLLPFLRRFT